MSKQALIAGGGIGGMAAALACRRAGWEVRLFERAAVFSEVGAGVQLGPNVTRLLHDWGLQAALAQAAAFPKRLQVCDAGTGRELGALRLGQHMIDRYGAPYATVHRADLHGVLYAAVRGEADVALNLNQSLAHFTQTADTVCVRAAPSPAALDAAPPDIEGDVLIGADGLWSPVRQWLLGDGLPRVSGHLAYRALVRQDSLPAALRSQQVTVWLSPRLHVVQYPVRGGDWLNIVAIAQTRLPGPVQNLTPDRLDHWDHSGNAAELQALLSNACAALQGVVRAVPQWRLWLLCDRPPMRGPHQHARGRVALLGDAAHPMRPYLAQGAGMAIEDAAELGRALRLATDPTIGVPAALGHYALNRWQRNARVQARAERNGRIFHATGPLRWARNTAMGVLGERLLDMPWLYGAR
ncbi:FAD-dependent oxidoreductase [Rhodoferax koreense]|uniref:FAD-dependent oxidoreductase n=1 Tax=Rhodoferax koreensis TaxID=1842727 RepID=A0A1P8K0C4_9BURK|nr:FAD-dependent monooxygenase [Rhodoferax koreense]APW39460.1 FAD-dependent oxidoreductase [Rhodoferax koreense]